MILGGSFQFAVDFDVAPDRAFTLVSCGDEDMFLLKLDCGGGFRWARVIGGYQPDALRDLDVDGQGNVYTTGYFRDRVDFDPLDGSYILVAADVANPNRYEAFLSKLDGDGRFVWAAQFDTVGTSDGYALDVDDSGRITSVGLFNGTTDFDPGEGVQTRTSPLGAAGYLSRVRQLAPPRATLVGLPGVSVDRDGTLTEGASLALGVTVVDADSSSFTYRWTVTRAGED